MIGRTKRRTTAAAPLVLVGAVVLLAAFLPWLSGGVDIYAHLLWSHQTMRCLSVGSLPVWLPDLNAGFGSPGIRLYSPAGPVVSGVLGLPFDDAAAGLRLTLAAAVFGVFWVARRLDVGWVPPVLVLASSVFVADLVVRAAWAQVLAVPLAWWVLEESVSGNRFGSSWRAAGCALAALWLIHAPTAVMVSPLAVASTLGRQRWCRSSWLWLVRAGILGAALTAWHWLPLASELSLVSARSGLTEGIFSATRNYLGSSAAHMAGLNRAHSVTAVAFLVIVALLSFGAARGHRCRWVAVLGSVALATWLAVPLMRIGVPLEWLQFPWRWLVPAALLLAAPAGARVRRGGVLGAVVLLAWLLPLVMVPWEAPVRMPKLGVEKRWVELSRAVRPLGGNPFVIDVVEHRPPSYEGFAAALSAFGHGTLVRARGEAEMRVEVWRPLRRRVIVDAPRRVEVALRLLRYPWWRASVDGQPAAIGCRRAEVAISVPAGHHVVDVWWGGNPLAKIGIAAALAAIATLAWGGRFRRNRVSEPVPGDRGSARGSD